MAEEQSNWQNSQNRQFLQVDPLPPHRKISSPYPLYPFKKPGEYHPSYQQPMNYHPQTYQSDDQPPDYQSHNQLPVYQSDDHPPVYQSNDYPPDYQSSQPQSCAVNDQPQPYQTSSQAVQKPSGSPSQNRTRDHTTPLRQTRETRALHSQGKDSSNLHGEHSTQFQTHPERSRNRAMSGKPKRYPPYEERDTASRDLLPIDQQDYYDDRKKSLESDLELKQVQGSMTDDDKLNESEKDRRLEHRTSDDEAERGLEILRQLHEQSEAAQRLEEPHEVRVNKGQERRERTKETKDEKPKQKSTEYRSTTPTNFQSFQHSHATSRDDFSAEEEEDEERERQPEEPPTSPQPFSPVTLLPPADVEVYYSLSKRQYHIAPSFSEPSQSRQLTPGSIADTSRAHSQALPPVDDPGGRYARRATRANVLNRAERLLNSRLQSHTQNPRYDLRQDSPRNLQSPDVSLEQSENPEPKVRKSLPPQHVRESADRSQQVERKFSETNSSVKRVAFVDVGDDDINVGQNAENGDSSAVTSFREAWRDEKPGMTLEVTSQRESGGGRVGEGNVGGLRSSRRQYSHSPWKSSDVITPMKRRVVKKKPGVRSTHVGNTFSGSEDDVAHYGLRDPARYELTPRAPLPLPPVPSFQSQEYQGPSDQGSKKARRVWFFRNGDPDFKARLVVISKKLFPNLETLLVALENIVPTVAGVKHIFSLPEGRKIRSVRELQDGCHYVCSSVNRLNYVKYGDVREQHWKSGRVTHKDTHLFTVPHDLTVESQSPPPLYLPPLPANHPSLPQEGVVGSGGAGRGVVIVTVVSNLHRDSQHKLILNARAAASRSNLEDLCDDLERVLHVPYPPVTALCTTATPPVKIENFGQLFEELPHTRIFLACGEEGVPQDPSHPHPPTPRHRGRRRSRRLSRHSLEARKMMTARTSRRGNQRRKEAVHCDINGKRRELFAPSQIFVDTEGKKPDRKLKLEWVYGYRGRDVRQNLSVLGNTGEIVYFVAAVVVLYDRRTHTQKHYTAHTEEVTCLALHPSSPYVASAQLGGSAPEEAVHVRVWDALTLSTYSVIGLGYFLHGVSSLAFCHGESDLLLTLEDSEQHVLSVWDWSYPDTPSPCASTTTTNAAVVLGSFYPSEDRIVVVTAGREHVFFWTVFWRGAEGKILRDKKSGVFQGEVPDFVTSVCFSPSGDVITGDSNGSIVVWSRDQEDIFYLNQEASLPMAGAHKKSVSSLVMLYDGTLLSGGGREIKAWDSHKGFELLLERELPEVYGNIRQLVSLNSGGGDGQLLVGTARDLILQGSLRSLFRPLVQGHSEEVWTVKGHPTEASFFTAGHDAYVIRWSSRDHRPEWTARDTKPCTSMAVDPRGGLVAVGTTSGKVTLYGVKDGKERNSFQAGQAQVNTLAFAPAEAGKQGYLDLAVGCHDGFIYLCRVQEEGRVEGLRCAKARSNMYIMHLDWSSDGRYLQSVLGDYDLIFWDVHSLLHTKSGRTMRDVQWNTVSAPVGFSLVGAWNRLQSGEVINVACRSADQSCLLTGDSRGRLRLFTYPSIASKPYFREVKPFSSNTTAAEFLFNDTGVLTSGGNDAAVMQYAMEDTC